MTRYWPEFVILFFIILSFIYGNQMPPVINRKPPLVTAKVELNVNFECGCLASKYIGPNSYTDAWRIIPCKDHTEDRGEVARKAAEAIRLIVNP